MGTKSTQPTKYLATYTEINNQVSEKTSAGLYCCVYAQQAPQAWQPHPLKCL